MEISTSKNDSTPSHRLPFEIISSILSTSSECKSQLLDLLSLSSACYSFLLPQLYSEILLDTRQRFDSFQETVQKNEELGVLVRSLTIATDETLSKSPLEGEDRSVVTSKVRDILRICSAFSIEEENGLDQCEDVEVVEVKTDENKDRLQDQDWEQSKTQSSRVRNLRKSFINNLPKQKKTLDDLALEPSLLFSLPPFGSSSSSSNLSSLPNLNPIRLVTNGSNPRPQLNWFLRSSSISIEASSLETTTSSSSSSTTNQDITKRLKEIRLVNVLGAPNRILKGSETLSGQLIRASYAEAYGEESMTDETSFSNLSLEQGSEPQMPRPGAVVQEVKLQSLVKEVLVLLVSSSNLEQAKKDQIVQEMRPIEDEDEDEKEQDEEMRASGIKIVLQGPKGWGLEKVEERLKVQARKEKREENDLKRVEICFV